MQGAFLSSCSWNVGSQWLLACRANHNKEPYLLSSASETEFALQEPEMRIQLQGNSVWGEKKGTCPGRKLLQTDGSYGYPRGAMDRDALGTDGAEQLGKGGKGLRDPSQGDLILLIKAASSQGLDNLSCCRLFTAVECNTPMNKASQSMLERERARGLTVNPSQQYLQLLVLLR